MDPQYPRAKTFSDVKREREVSLLYGAAYRDLPRIHASHFGNGSSSVRHSHAVASSTDSTLTALAQLAVIRLRAGRSMISLVDDQWEHILSEATPNTSLIPSAPDTGNALCFGSASIPRSMGMCENVLNIDLDTLHTDEFPFVVVRDVRDSNVSMHRTNAMGCQPRFYASAPLLSPAGALVGCVCIFDDAPRPEGLSLSDKTCFREIVQTVMSYLQSYTIHEKFRVRPMLLRYTGAALIRFIILAARRTVLAWFSLFLRGRCHFAASS